MHQSVKDYVWKFLQDFEGRVPYMYLDGRGFVTVGLGFLAQPVQLALQMPFVRKDSEMPASQEEIGSDWDAVHKRQDLAKSHFRAFEPLTALKLRNGDIDAIAQRKLDAYVATLMTQYPEFSGFESWPADAQLGLIGMAWNMGPGFATGWPQFRAACAAQDFAGAAAQSHMANGAPQRNEAHRVLFENASKVIADGLPVDTLLYSQVVFEPILITESPDPEDPDPTPVE